MQLTWLDLLAANMGAMLWLWGVQWAIRWVRTEPKKAVPLFIAVAFVGFGLLLFTLRASHWYEATKSDDPYFIVPPVAQK